MGILNQIKNELHQLGIKPKKSLGQNFLVNESVYQKIIGALELEPDDIVIEVGSGLGTLTEFLAASGTRIIAVEKDNRLIDYLKHKFQNKKNVTLLEDDILKFNPRNTSTFIQNARYKLVGNIPYYLTSHLIRTVFEDWPVPSIIVLMLQKEVAQRICAKPPNMSLLAVSIQYYAQPKIIAYASRGNFYPVPEVDSAIIKLVSSFQLRDSSKDLTKNYKLTTANFFKIVRAGFAGKRKQLGNNLSAGLNLEKKYVEEKLTSIDINPMRRAETLTIEEWQSIAITFLPH